MTALLCRCGEPLQAVIGPDPKVGRLTVVRLACVGSTSCGFRSQPVHTDRRPEAVDDAIALATWYGEIDRVAVEGIAS